MEQLINTLKSMSQAQLVEFCKKNPHLRVKIQQALRAMKKEMAVRDEIRGRLARYVEVSIYM